MPKAEPGGRLTKRAAGLVLALALAQGEWSPAGADVKPGMTLDASTADEAKDLLPPEIYRHYKNGEYYNRVVDFPDSRCRWDDGVDEGTRQNGQRLVLSPQREPVEKETGKRPEYIEGLPFPDIRPDDPDAGYKVLWNLNYGYFIRGNGRNWIMLDWVSRAGLDRSVAEEYWALYYDGQLRQYSPASNPQNLLVQTLAVSKSPADVNGTATLGYRFKDPGIRDLSWVYVPALRRVRSLSPANRSDGFLGSDASQDDGFFFEGKVEDFTWKVIGHRDGLRLVDPDSIAGKVSRRALPGGGWRTTSVNNGQIAGFQAPAGAWTGVAWAPVGGALAKRHFWVVEGVPKDKYYLYGKMELWVDDVTWQGAWNRKFSKKGELENVYEVMGYATQDLNAHERYFATTMSYQAAENIKAERATVTGITGPGEDPPNDLRVPLEPGLFDPQSLDRFGK